LVLTLTLTLSVASPATAGSQTRLHTQRAARCRAHVHRAVAGRMRRHALCRPAAAEVGRRHAWRAPAVNPFGAMLFGIAAGGAVQSEGAAAQALDLSIDQAAGARWLRIDINWAQVQASGPASYDWSAIDAVVAAAEARGMHVLGVIVYTPAWARPAGTNASYAPPRDAYAAFAGAAAAHYGALGVHAFELWNEENNRDAWSPAPDPAAYAALLRAAYPAIKQADPGATVLVGGLSPAADGPGRYPPAAFLNAVYADGAGRDFDAVAVHPYCWPAMPGDRLGWSAWMQTYGSPVSVRSVMVAHGDAGKKVWGTEFGAPTDGPPGTYVSPLQQARIITAGYRLWSGYAWAGPLFVYQGRDQGTDPSTDYDFYGLTDYYGRPKPAFRAYLQASLAVRTGAASEAWRRARG
jgi:hypothetical protein